MMFLSHNKTTRGNLAVETIGILIVILLLVAVAVPSYWSRAENARFDQAKADIQTLADGQADAAERYGYYLPLQLLDNLSAANTERTDALANEPDTLALVDPSGDLQAQTETPKLLGGGEDAPALADWAGPLAMTKRVYLTAEGDSYDIASLDASAIRRDYPMDPWGNPYRFYSPLGLVGTRAGESDAAALDTDEFSDGRLTAEDDRFNSFAIVSFGPDGQSDSTTEEDDDVIYLFSESGEDD